MCHHLRKDNIGYFRRDSHGLCRIASYMEGPFNQKFVQP